MTRIWRHLIPALCLAVLATAFLILKNDGRSYAARQRRLELKHPESPDSSPLAQDGQGATPRLQADRPTSDNGLDITLREVSAKMSVEDEAATQWLLRTARTHPSPIIRSNAVHALASRASERERMIAALDELFLEEKDPTVLHAALCTFRDFRAGTRHALDLLSHSNEPLLIRSAAALLADQPAPGHADAIDACIARLPEDPAWPPVRAELRESSLNLREPGRLERLRTQHTCTEHRNP
ncbi:MAG: hypothetical protein HYY16_14555 [Planctomycetes bacterium]|nr:hypothetical protein [Planctomycetota bacterium]